MNTLATDSGEFERSGLGAERLSESRVVQVSSSISRFGIQTQGAKNSDSEAGSLYEPIEDWRRIKLR